MPVDTADMRIQGGLDRATRQRVSRLQFRGWSVDVAGTTISIPHQAITTAMSADDLAACLDAARALSRQHRPPVAAPAAPPRACDLDAITAILQSARDLARSHWHPTRFDIYAVTSQAWETAGMNIAHTALIRALQQVLPDDTRLIDVNDRSTCEQICKLYDSAITALRSTPQPASGAA